MFCLMTSRDIIIEKLKKELPTLKKNFGIKKIGLFGSAAKGLDNIESDIDIFVDFEKPIGLQFMDFAEYIEKLLGKRVDILTTEGIKSIRIKEVATDIKRNIIYV